jgi:hypothetical protein
LIKSIARRVTRLTRRIVNVFILSISALLDFEAAATRIRMVQIEDSFGLRTSNSRLPSRKSTGRDTAGRRLPEPSLSAMLVFVLT